MSHLFNLLFTETQTNRQIVKKCLRNESFQYQRYYYKKIEMTLFNILYFNAFLIYYRRNRLKPRYSKAGEENDVFKRVCVNVFVFVDFICFFTCSLYMIFR